MIGLTIGDIAKEAGVHIETVRYYERRGILKKPRRSSSGYRLYGQETVRVIRFVKRAQDLGFTLKEVKQLIELRGTTGRAKSDVRSVAEAKVRDIDNKMRSLQAMRQALETLLEACACSDNQPSCPIIESLNNADLNAGIILRKSKHKEEQNQWKSAKLNCS